MEDSTVPRAIRKTRLWRFLGGGTKQFTAPFAKRACGAFRGGDATASFAHRAALPSQLPMRRFSCEHGICTQKAASELLVKKVLTFVCSCDNISFVTEICDMDF